MIRFFRLVHRHCPGEQMQRVTVKFCLRLVPVDVGDVKGSTVAVLELQQRVARVAEQFCGMNVSLGGVIVRQIDTYAEK